MISFFGGEAALGGVSPSNNILSLGETNFSLKKFLVDVFSEIKPPINVHSVCREPLLVACVDEGSLEVLYLGVLLIFEDFLPM